jgi:hypothetical protein
MARTARLHSRARAFCLALLTLVAACGAFSVEELNDGVCPSGEKTCNIAGTRRCVSLSDPTTGCGRPSCTPCALKNVSLHFCDRANVCQVSVCASGFADCDSVKDGCETETAFDVLNCGTCDMACATPPNAVGPACMRGACEIGGCLKGFADCNLIVRDGCEVELMRDARHCGACNHPCDETQSCVAGECR